jgi:hypothetical protein
MVSGLDTAVSSRKALVGDYVLGDVQDGFTGEVKKAFRQMVEGRLADEFLAAHFLERASSAR